MKKYFDKTFFRFLLGFVFILAAGIFFLAYVQAKAATIVNINTADSTELETLNGIGPSKAEAIVNYRTNNGPFASIEDIKNVSGIGDVTFGNIKDFITVGSVGTSDLTTTSESSTTTPLGSSAPDPELKVSIGGDKKVTVGEIVEFRASSNVSQATFQWNFGDGTGMFGSVVSHVYSYPGEYVAVLKASYNGKLTKTRVNVSVQSDSIRVTYASPERIEIMNSGKSEVDISNRAIFVAKNKFVFPEETIIKASQKISFLGTVTHLAPQNIGEVAIALADGRMMNKTFAKVAITPVKTVAKTETKAETNEVKNINLTPTSTVNFTAAVINSTSTKTENKISWLTSVKHFLRIK